MANKKFKATERTIFITYYRLSDLRTAKTIAKKAHISRSTLYRHHPAPRFISDDYEQYLLRIYRRKLKRLLSNNKTELRTVFFRTLLFIHNNKVTFTALFRDGHKDVIEKMLLKIKERILSEWNLATDTNKLYGIYQNEVLSIIEIWSKTNFSIEGIDQALNDIMYLTKTSPRRLAGILK